VASAPWKVSLHGGHSGDFCLHGGDTLEEMLDAAVAFGYTTFGVTAHSPRSDANFLYPEEIEAGYSPADLDRDFASYVSKCRELARKFEGRLEVLVGAEIEIVPESGYAKEMADLRNRHDLDYIVGSVHWVDEMPIDVTRELFDEAVNKRGGLEPFLVRYFNLVEEMVNDLQPEVVGHFDRPRLYTDNAPEFESASVVEAANSALQACKDAGCILDLNVSAIRKELEHPYPAPQIVAKAKELGIPFCFGDDSHRISAVGENLAEGREYLLGQGISEIKVLTRENGTISKKTVPLR
jgi:histidinol-phosphatase (PHP family)